jgi:hypothetical protein
MKILPRAPYLNGCSIREFRHLVFHPLLVKRRKDLIATCSNRYVLMKVFYTDLPGSTTAASCLKDEHRSENGSADRMLMQNRLVYNRFLISPERKEAFYDAPCLHFGFDFS